MNMNQTLQHASDAGIQSIKTLRYLLVLADPRALTKTEEARLSGIKLPNLRVARDTLQKLGLVTKRGTISAKGFRLVEKLSNPW